MNRGDYQAWVDIIKGFAIIAVVVLHVNCSLLTVESIPLKSVLGNSWHMPVFFLVAGFFLSWEKLHTPFSFSLHKFRYLYCRLLYFYVPILLLHNFFISVGLYSETVVYGGKEMAVLSLADYARKLVEVVFFMGREPYASPLWFVYVLFVGMIVISLFATVAHKILKDEARELWAVGIVLSVLCSLSLYLSTVMEFTVPRLSVLFPAMWLVFLGFLVRNYFKITFNKTCVAIVSTVVLLSVLLCNDERCMMTNHYSDTVQLTACGLFALYPLAYVAKRIEGSAFGRVVAYVGNKSFYVMALHLLSISCLAMLLDKVFGWTLPIDVLGSQTDSASVYLLLVAGGIGIPVAIAWMFDVVKKRVA